MVRAINYKKCGKNKMDYKILIESLRQSTASLITSIFIITVSETAMLHSEILRKSKTISNMNRWNFYRSES